MHCLIFCILLQFTCHRGCSLSLSLQKVRWFFENVTICEVPRIAISLPMRMNETEDLKHRLAITFIIFLIILFIVFRFNCFRKSDKDVLQSFSILHFQLYRNSLWLRLRFLNFLLKQLQKFPFPFFYFRVTFFSFVSFDQISTVPVHGLHFTLCRIVLILLSLMLGGGVSTTFLMPRCVCVCVLQLLKTGKCSLARRVRSVWARETKILFHVWFQVFISP